MKVTELTIRMLFLFVFFSYLGLQFIFFILSKFSYNSNPESSFIESIFDSKIAINTKEILYACIISIALGFLISLFVEKKFLSRFAQFIRLSNRFGDQDVWDFIFNSSEPTDWVVIRDPKNNFIYEG